MQCGARVRNRDRRVIHRRDIDADGRSRLTAELVGDGIFEIALAIEVGRALESDLAVGTDRRGRAAETIYRDQNKILDTFLGVVRKKGRGIDDRDLVLDAEQIDIVLRIEAARPGKVLDHGAIPDHAIVEDNFLDARLGAEEMILDQHRIEGQHAADIFKLDEQVVALPDERDILGKRAGLDPYPVNIDRIAQLDDPVIVAVEAQKIGIRAKAALEQVLAVAAVEGVAAGRSDEMVAEHRADQHLDVDERIALGLARKALPKREIDRYRLVGGRIIGDVETAAAIDNIGAERAAQAIVARVAAHDIVMIASLNDLDPAERVAQRIAAARQRVGKVDRDAFGRQRIIGDIDAIAADERVGAAAPDEDIVTAPADQYIVAATAFEPVRTGVALDQIVIVGADDILDADQRITGRVAAARGAIGQRDLDALG